jgi:hypothetical protein
LFYYCSIAVVHLFTVLFLSCLNSIQKIAQATQNRVELGALAAIIDFCIYCIDRNFFCATATILPFCRLIERFARFQATPFAT